MSFNIIGTGSAYPKSSKTNADFAAFLDTSDEWIFSRTGIKSRYICTEETITELAFKAAAKALADADTSPGELDIIICATIGGDYLTPALGCILQQMLGANCPAFDINAACPGFIYGMDIADAYFKAHKIKKALIVGAEAISRYLDWEDRSTCVLFGDAAGAVVLGEGEDLLSIIITARGNPDVLSIKNLVNNAPFARPKEGSPYLQMNGQEVYKFAVSSMCRDLRSAIKKAGLEEDQIDFVLPHQANIRIIEAAQSKLKIAPGKYRTNIETFGNTSSASIPLLMDRLQEAGEFKPGHILALTSFGSGLTSGACIIKWQKQKRKD